MRGRRSKVKGQKPSPSLCTKSLHFVENWKPCSWSEVATPVFVQAVPGARVLFGDPQTYVEVECCSIFSAHCVKDFWVFPVYGLVAFLFMGYYARVCPLLRVVCLFVFLGPSAEFSGGHSNVFCFGVAGALMTIDALFLLLVLLIVYAFNLCYLFTLLIF